MEIRVSYKAGGFLIYFAFQKRPFSVDIFSYLWLGGNKFDLPMSCPVQILERKLAS